MANTIGVIGAGTMGGGIAQVAALAGYTVILYDIEQSAIDRGMQTIYNNLSKGVEKNKLTGHDAEKAKRNISTTLDLMRMKSATTVIDRTARYKTGTFPATRRDTFA